MKLFKVYSKFEFHLNFLIAQVSFEGCHFFIDKWFLQAFEVFWIQKKTRIQLRKEKLKEKKDAKENSKKYKGWRKEEEAVAE